MSDSHFDGLLPAQTVIVEATPELWQGSLWPEEQACVARAVPKRVREFTAGRNCARRALERLGLPPGPLLVGASREPLFPEGIAGSITHTHDFCAAAAVRIGAIRSLGIDAEPDAPLSPGLLPTIAAPDEASMLAGLRAGQPAHHWDKLLFCIKEAFFKAYFPIGRRFIGFAAARVRIDACADAPASEFRIELREPDQAYFEGRAFAGRFAFRGGLALAAIALPASPTL